MSDAVDAVETPTPRRKPKPAGLDVEALRRALPHPAVPDLARPFDLLVGADGTITQNGQVTGRLSVVRFDTLGVLEKGGDSLYRNTSNAQPIEAADAQVHQGSLESSNVNPLIEITNLVEISRAYESISKFIENTTDLSRRAVERLGKAA